MRRFLLLAASLWATQLFAQGLSGKWLAYEGSDGSGLVVTVTSTGGGQAELSLARRELAISYGEGSQFWGTFRATGGYYFIVKGVKSEKIQAPRQILPGSSPDAVNPLSGLLHGWMRNTAPGTVPTMETTKNE